MTEPLVVTGNLQFRPRRGQCLPAPAPTPSPAPIGRVPRAARLLALAIKFEALLRQRVFDDFASLARLGRVSRARVSQIMNLVLLAPDIQEEILFLPATQRGRDPVHLRQLQVIALVQSWQKQRILWHELKASLGRFSKS